MVYTLNGKVDTVSQNVNAANDKLDTLLTQSSTSSISDSVVDTVVSEVGATGEAETKVRAAIQWLKNNNYAK